MVVVRVVVVIFFFFNDTATTEIYTLSLHDALPVYTGAGVEGRPGLILFVQTFGDLLTFNPHIHVLAADGVFRADGAFVVLPAIPVKLLEGGFRSEVLKQIGRAHV